MNTPQAPTGGCCPPPSCYALPPVLERPARILPPNIIDRMAPSDRASIGVKTSAEHRAKAAAQDEREIQKGIASYLRLLDIPFNQDAMHRKRTGTVGWPDFVFPYKGKFIAWEVKCPWSRALRPEQAAMSRDLQRAGAEWRLITSVAEAQAHLREMDGISRGRGDTEART